MSEKEMQEMMDKANKWHALDKAIGKFYCNSEGGLHGILNLLYGRS